jgi:hypothetical protein
LAAWDAAAGELQSYAHELFRGSEPDPALMVRLMAAVESARQVCERLAGPR